MNYCYVNRFLGVLGMFGFPRDAFINPDHPDNFMGDRIRGFGFMHSGAIPSPFQFLSALAFVFDDVILPNPGGFGRKAQGIMGAADRSKLS